jgi:mannan endo-1,4-beta-mannosidase
MNHADGRHFRLILLIVLIAASALRSGDYPGFRVIGRHLYDKCGEKVILRGVNNPNIWIYDNTDGFAQYIEIEQTGANVVRIVWETRGSASELDDAIANCIAFGMIPMIECHDATYDNCNLAVVDEIVDYWTSPAVSDVIISHEEYLLLNIANEAGDWVASASAFRDTYESAILEIRNADIHVPLIIDATDCGKKIDVLQSEGPYLIGVDPDSNLMFSVHMWWNIKTGYPEEKIAQEIEQSVNMNLPLLVGEFGSWFDWENDEMTPETVIPYLTIIEQCHLHEIGYIAWSWFGNNVPILDMTTDGTYETLYDWGLEVAVTDDYSIQNTSVRSYFIIYGACNPSGFDYFERNEIPALFVLHPNYPNPFNLQTRIEYCLLETARVQSDIFDEMGRHVITLVNDEQTSGMHTLHWSGTDELGNWVPSGVYVCRMKVIQAGSTETQFRKMILMK